MIHMHNASQQAEGAYLTLVQGGVPLDPRVGAALQLLDLNTISIMREATHDTKLLLASGPNAIVLSFRGTASAAAAWADLQVLVLATDDLMLRRLIA